MKPKTYIFGDPKIREKVHEDEIREGLRFAAFCVERFFTCMGFAAVAAVFLMVSAW